MGDCVDICIFDEAHYVVADAAQELVFPTQSEEEKESEECSHDSEATLLDFCEKTMFLTATPKNANGVVMFSELNEEDEEYDMPDCGPLAYEYNHLDAVRDNVCKDFDICINFYSF